VATTEFGLPGDSADSEFSSLSLYIAADNAAAGMGAPIDTLSGTYSSTQVCYGGPCNGTTGMNFESLNSPGTYYAMYAVTFSGLNLALTAGLYDFAVGDTPIGNNTFALLISDPSNSGSSTEDSASLNPNGYLYFFADGTAGSPLATYQYITNNGDINNYNNGADVNVIISGTSTPEPSSLGLLGLGFGAMLLGLRQRVRG
jgi:hypothetical protein